MQPSPWPRMVESHSVKTKNWTRRGPDMLATTKFLRIFLYGFLYLMCGPIPRASATNYTTNFPQTQNPIAASGNCETALDWGIVQTSSGMPCGVGMPSKYRDPTAILTGTRGPDHTVQATVKVDPAPSGCCHEVELRLRSTITAHSITGDGFFCSVVPRDRHLVVARWNGAVANFIMLYQNGCVLCVNASALTAYKNGTELYTVADGTSNENPGIGFCDDQGNHWSSFGFSSITASGGSTTRGTSTQGTLGSGTYTTDFPLTENPISEDGNWLEGQGAGGNLWGNVQTNGAMAFGVSEPTQFGDPTAILTGTWAATQTATGRVKVNTVPKGACCHEAEVRLRMVISSKSITGYEVYCSVMPDNLYCHIARWNGPSGSYCNIEQSAPSTFLADGDVLMGTVTGTNPVIITGYKNGVQIMQAQDTGASCDTGGAAGPWTSGNPGIGFYDSRDNNWKYFGFSSFTASGLSTGQKTQPSRRSYSNRELGMDRDPLRSGNGPVSGKWGKAGEPVVTICSPSMQIEP